MSNLWINWRFGCYHLQIGPDRPRVRWSRNPIHAPGSPYRADPEWRWFEAY